MTLPCPSSAEFLAEIQSEFPQFRVVDKTQDKLSKLIDGALRVVTFGKQHRYVSHYHTVLGNTLYVPESWQACPEVDRVITLRHERIHLRQGRRYGAIGMALIYTLPILPVGLAWGRARIEWEAYVETLRATAEYKGMAAAESPSLRTHIMERFTGADYLWMWPFPSQLHRWYDAALAQIAAELGCAQAEA